MLVAAITPHNGWLYYNGGDGTWYYTTAWVLGHGHIPLGYIGYGYPLLIAPLAAIAGPSMFAGMPLVIVFNALVLAPIALLCIYGLTNVLCGRRVAYVASAIWVVIPVLAIPDFYARYHGRYVDQTLPAVIGLTPTRRLPLDGSPAGLRRTSPSGRSRSEATRCARRAGSRRGSRSRSSPRT